jgi:hypothetical protein
LPNDVLDHFLCDIRYEIKFTRCYEQTCHL